MFQYRRESGEEVVRGFRVFAAEAERARDEHRRDGQPRRDTVGKQARVLDRKRRHEHECEVIDDVIEPPAVEHRRALLDAGEARQHPSIASITVATVSQRNATARLPFTMLTSAM